MLQKKQDKKYDVIQFNIINLLNKQIDVSLFNVNSLFQNQSAVDYLNTTYNYPSTTLTLGIAYGSYTDQIFALNRNGASYYLDIINPYTNAVITRNLIGVVYNAIVYDSYLNVLWLWDTTSANIAKFDILSLTFTHYTLSNHSIAIVTTLFPASSQLIVFGQTAVVVKQFIVLNSGTLSEAFYSVVGFSVAKYGVAYDGSEYAWVSVNTGGGSLIKFSLITYTSTSVTGLGWQGDCLVTKGNFVYISDKTSPLVHKYDVVNNSFSTIALSITAVTTQMYLLDNVIYIAGNRTLPNFNYLFGVSTQTDTELSVITFATSGTTSYLAVEQTKKSVYVSTNTTMYEYAVDNSFATTGSAINYSTFLNQLANEPKNIIKLDLNTQTQPELNNVIQFVKKDASGINCYYPILPNITVSVNQYQPGVAQIRFNNNEFILGLNSYINSYKVEANSTVQFLMYYNKFSLSAYLSGSIKKTFNDVVTYNPNSVTKKQLNEQDALQNTPYITPEAAWYLLTQDEYSDFYNNKKLKKHDIGK